MNNQRKLKWPEVWSLAALNAAIVISWIAYHDYQPKLLANFGLTQLSSFLIISKALVLVGIPPLAGFVADRVLRKGGKYFIVFTVGIGITSMIFMIVASIIKFGPTSPVSNLLPLMVVLWLISMNIFHSPANSMIEMFAPARKLPIVMGVLIMISELLYALEPVVVFIIDFLGDTLTFITGGILIGVTGFIFNKVSSDEVLQRKQETLAIRPDKITRRSSFGRVVATGLIIGICHAFLASYLPMKINLQFLASIPLGWKGEYISSIFLALAALVAFPLSIRVSKGNIKNALIFALSGIVLGITTLLISFTFNTLLIGGIVLALSFSIASVSGLPFAIKNLSLKHLTLGVGVFFGATELFDGIFDIVYGL